MRQFSLPYTGSCNTVVSAGSMPKATYAECQPDRCPFNPCCHVAELTSYSVPDMNAQLLSRLGHRHHAHICLSHPRRFGQAIICAAQRLSCLALSCRSHVSASPCLAIFSSTTRDQDEATLLAEQISMSISRCSQCISHLGSHMLASFVAFCLDSIVCPVRSARWIDRFRRR